MRTTYLDLASDLSPGEVAEKARSAKLRYVWAKQILQKTRPIIIHGRLKPSRIPIPGTSLGERASDCVYATTVCHRTVGLMIYIAEDREPKRYMLLTDGRQIPLPIRTRLILRTLEQSWACCDLLCKVDRIYSEAALEGILELPAFVLAQALTSRSQIEPFLTQNDVEESDRARILFEMHQNRFLSELACNLGMETVLPSEDTRLRQALELDKVRTCGEPKQPSWRDSEYKRRFWRSLETFRRRQLLPSPLWKLEVCRDLTRNWTTRGYIFLSKSSLADLMNRRHNAHYTPAGIAQLCRRLALPTKRATKALPKYKDEYLDELINHFQNPPRPVTTGFIFD